MDEFTSSRVAPLLGKQTAGSISCGCQEERSRRQGVHSVVRPRRRCGKGSVQLEECGERVVSGRLKFRNEVRKEVMLSGLALFYSGVEPALVGRSVLFNILFPFCGMSGVPSVSIVCLFVCCLYEFSEGWKEVLSTTFRSRLRLQLEGVVSPFSPKPRLGLPLSFDSQLGLALVTVACFFLSHEPPTQSTSKTKKNTENKSPS